MKIRFSLIVLFLLTLSTVSLIAQDIKIKRERVFTGPALYGFMNGGADLFFEYGVERLTNRDIVYKGEEFTVDVYDMPTPEDAFGIYSIHIFKCTRADTLECINCLSDYQYQTIQGNSYISVVFPSGSAKAKKLVPEILEKLLPPAEESNKIRLPRLLQSESSYSGRIKYVRGPLAAVNASVGFYTSLRDIAFENAWIIKEKKAYIYHALVYFKSSADKERQRLAIDPAKILREGNNYLYYVGEEILEENTETKGFGF